MKNVRQQLLALLLYNKFVYRAAKHYVDRQMAKIMMIYTPTVSCGSCVLFCLSAQLCLMLAQTWEIGHR